MSNNTQIISHAKTTVSHRNCIRLVMLAAVLLFGFLCVRSATPQFKNEVLKYVITYKWGLVSKEAGEATVTLKNQGDNYQVVLAARTKPWADKIFMVRDTLKSTILSDPFRPLRYEKISHEGSKYGKDIIVYNYSGTNIKATADRIKIKEGKVKKSRKHFSSQQEAFDMLSIFYFLRTVDYSRIKNGHSLKKIVFSGSRAETITIRNLGIQTVTLRDKSKRKAYHIRFRFTSEGGKKTSDDMDTWISTDGNSIPLQLVGNLPLGQIKCYLTSSSVL